MALSGGKDSWTLLHILESLRRRAPVSFSLIAVTVHPGFPGFQTGLMEEYLNAHDFEYRIIPAPIHQLMLEKLTPDDTPCALCARIKRGVLYTQARELGCTKIALGHHREDFIETLLLNQFYNGKIKAMAPLLIADNGRNVVIRPLVYVPEDDIIRYAASGGFPHSLLRLSGLRRSGYEAREDKKAPGRPRAGAAGDQGKSACGARGRGAPASADEVERRVASDERHVMNEDGMISVLRFIRMRNEIYPQKSLTFSACEAYNSAQIGVLFDTSVPGGPFGRG